MRAVGGIVVLLMAGCAAPEPRPNPIAFSLDAGGIQLLDRPQRVDFGRTDHSTLSAMTKLTASDPMREGACVGGGRYAAFGDGVALHFARGDFVGWSRREQDGTIRQAGRACVQA
ncbi:MAG: hypothetical protein AAF340_02970 [Pseudomonadota bacterium]